MADVDVAWAAGFFDGEGHFGLSKPRQRKAGHSYTHAIVRISQTEPTTLERFRIAVDRGAVRGPYAPPRNGFSRRQRWEYAVEGSGAVEVGRLLLPYLSGPKTAQVERALAAVAAQAALLPQRRKDADPVELHRMYWIEGRPLEECAPALDVSIGTLRRILVEHGLPRRNAAQQRWVSARRTAGVELYPDGCGIHIPPAP